MKTLIELYDERPLDNVLATEVFRPEQTVFLCPQEAGGRRRRETLEQYFRHRGVDTKLVFLNTSLLDTAAVEKQLLQAVERWPDCAVDISGGTDAALFAAGLLAARKDVPVFTYSRKRNRFYNIRSAPFAHELPCPVKLTVEDCFLMAGGAMRKGRVDNAVLKDYLDVIDPFFRLFMDFRKDWPRIVNYMQRVSQTPRGEEIPLKVRGDYVVKGERGSRVAADPDALRRMEKIGFLEELQIREDEEVSFRFRDHQIRAWLRDVGSVLELAVYKACLETGRFDDVRTSAVVDWQVTDGRDDVSNELDVMATRGVTPVFISCKTCDVHTEAVNELAILRDRFGSGIARAAIVTAESGNPAVRHRAAELGIDMIDLRDLRGGAWKERLRALSE